MTMLFNSMMMGGSPKFIINNIQEFSISLAAAATSNTATITSVDTTKAFVIWSGQNSNATSAATKDRQFAHLALTNGTTVTATRQTGTTNTMIVYGSVVEFKSASVVNMQTGTIALSALQTSNTATITSVSTSNAFVVYGGLLTTVTSGGLTAVFNAIDLTNATTVTATRNTSTDTTTVAYTVVELTSGIIKSVQKISSALTSAGTTSDITITSVTTANTIVLHNGYHTALSQPTASNLYRFYLTSTTNLRYERRGTSTTTKTVKATVLELNSGYISRKTAAQVTFTTADTQIDTTVTAFTQSKSLVNYCGGEQARTTDYGGSDYMMGMLSTSTTNIRAIRNSTNSFAADAAWELIEFN